MLRYKEIKLELLEIINEMGNGDKLPSRPILCKRLDTSRATIDKAIGELERDGILESRFGSGTYVARKLEGVITNCKNWCLIVPDITETIYAKLARSVESAARGYNANVILCNSENNVQKQSEYIKRLILSGIDGFIIVPVVTRSVMEGVVLYQSLIQSKIPFVFCNREVEGVNAPTVKSNDYFGGYIATMHLLEHGYRNVAYLARQHYRTSVERCQGYLSALQHSGIEIVRKRIVMMENSSLEACYEKVAEMLKADPEMDAVFCFDERIAMQAMQAVGDGNRLISDEIGIIGYNDNEELAKLKVPLTTVSYGQDEIGRMAARVLAKMIDRKEKDTFGYYLVQPQVVERKSCKGKKD